jgi:hypothetical protein
MCNNILLNLPIKQRAILTQTCERTGMMMDDLISYLLSSSLSAIEEMDLELREDKKEVTTLSKR